MNFAFPAIVIFIIALPGFAFRSKLKRVERSSLDYSPFGQVVTEAIAWAGILHGLLIALSYLIVGKIVRVDILIRLLTTSLTASDIAIVSRDALWIAFYFIAVMAMAFVVPFLIRLGISKARLDHYSGTMSGLFRFHKAPWYYLLSGADFKKGEEPDMINVAAVVNVAGQAYLYQGFLDEYFVDDQGCLDRLVLSQASRRPLDNDKKPLPDEEGVDSQENDLLRFYPIVGDYFVLRYEEAITLNVQYLKLSTATNSL